jgi:hypothetical protein
MYGDELTLVQKLEMQKSLSVSRRKDPVKDILLLYIVYMKLSSFLSYTDVNAIGSALSSSS